jgi:hypothetical protein
MQIQGYGGASSGPAFAANVLCIEVVGDTGPHLTVVDLLNLLAVANKEYIKDDVQLVTCLVGTYLELSSHRICGCTGQHRCCQSGHSTCTEILISPDRE